MLFDHAGLSVKDIARSRAFYVPALEPLGVGIIADYGEAIGFGELADGAGIQTGKQSFWLGQGAGGGRTHIAFSARTRAAVDAFYAAAMAAGGTDNGGPGVREVYSPNYYAAFVLDPDGNNVEAVCNPA